MSLDVRDPGSVVTGNLLPESPFAKVKVEVKAGTWEGGGNVGQ